VAIDEEEGDSSLVVGVRRKCSYFKNLKQISSKTATTSWRVEINNNKGKGKEKKAATSCSVFHIKIPHQSGLY
jgi:hypothetical protein